MKHYRRRNRHVNRRGAILLLIAICMIAVLGVMVMALDGGLLQRQKRIAQLAADAAAKAGAIEIFRNRTGEVSATAVREATRNGFTDGVGGHAVIVTYPSTDPAFLPHNKFVDVQVRDSVRTLFASILGRPMVPVNARAVGGVTGIAQACIVSLDPDDRNALIVQSGGHVDASGCKVSVNSNNSQAMCVTASEGGSLIASTIDVTGHYDTGCTGTVTGTITNGATDSADPLASVQLLVSDTASACIGGVYDPNQFKLVANATLNPSTGPGGVGAYCGGISAAKSGVMVTLNPGIYVIKGGGFNVASGASVQGAGVAIVDLNPPAGYGLSVNKFDVIDIAGDGTVNLSAMTTGTLAGIVFYTPRNQGVIGAVHLNNIHSSATAIIGGSMYFPDQELHVGSGNGPNTSLTINGGVIASVINFAADSYVHVLGFAGGTPYGVPTPSLVK